MKEHSNNFETEIKTYGRQQAVQVIFEQDGQQVVLDNENVFSVTPNYKASLLKSAMKSLILDCNVEIPVGTRLQFKYGILVNNAYEYLNFGYYIVNKIEKKEDARSYEITCYDKMMLTMVDYIDLEISYPITIRNYIAEICNYLEIDFGSNQDQFVNYDKEIPNELYLDENGNSLEYTFRDVLDELSQVTASIICIDENDQLVVKYPQRNGDYETIEGTSLYIENADDSKIDLELEGQTSQDGTPAPSTPIPVNNVTGEQVVRVCGKNLLDLSNMETGTKNGITISKDNYGNITISGTATSYTAFNIPCNLSGENTYSCNNWGSFTLYMQYNGHGISGGSASANKTFNGNVDNLVIGINKNVIINKTIRLQVEKGTSATTYESYQGKDYEINLGKNLLQYSNFTTKTENGITIINNNDGTFLVNGTATADVSLAVDPNNFMPMKGTWKMTGCPNGGSSSTYMLSAYVGYWGSGSPNIDTGNGTSITYTGNVKVRFYIKSGTTCNNLIFKPMVTYSNNASYDNFSPYFEPIELNKIGDYQDFIKKGTGKNLFDKDNLISGYRFGSDGELYANEGCYATEFINIKPNTTYATSWTIVWNMVVCLYDKDKHFTRKLLDGTNFTTTSEERYIRADVTGGYISTAQIEEGTQTTSYEPFGYGGKWYIEKNVGKVVLNGSEQWNVNQRTSGSQFDTQLNGKKAGSNTIVEVYSNYFIGTYFNNRDNILNSVYTGNNDSSIRILTNIESTTANFKTWLSTHNTIVYYVLSSPTYTLIENEELIEQLERVHLEQGLNNISVVTNNEQPVLKMSYVSNLIGIDEEQLKDINVNFGEKYGPINSVVIARAADSDFIFKEDEQSIAEDGLCEVKISDNQILNDENRTQFLDGIYYQLKGTEFYLNDFSSTGIVYLDLLDYYKVKVFDNYYKCLMLNDEIDITQGLQEQVFTERPKESETEYKSIAKQDKDIRKIGIIVNKVEGEITAEIIARQDTDEKVSNLTQTIGEISTTVSTTTTQVEDLENRVYTNETSISQNSDIITATISRIQKTEDDVETLQTNTEDVVKQLVFGDDGLTISAKGTTSDDMKLNLTNDAIKFLYQNNAVLTINGSTIEFSNASFKKLDLGNYVWQAEDDDSLSLIYEGE